MEFITWRDSFSVEIPSIDNQHAKLVKMVNEVHKKIYEGLDDNFLNQLIKELEAYSKYHFDYEEDLMRKFNFEGYKNHKYEHDTFKEEIAQYKQNLSARNTSELINFAGFLKNWLLKHIMGTDKKYSKLFVEKGIK